MKKYFLFIFQLVYASCSHESLTQEAKPFCKTTIHNMSIFAQKQLLRCESYTKKELRKIFFHDEKKFTDIYKKTLQYMHNMMKLYSEDRYVFINNIINEGINPSKLINYYGNKHTQFVIYIKELSNIHEYIEELYKQKNIITTSSNIKKHYELNNHAKENTENQTTIYNKYQKYIKEISSSIKESANFLIKYPTLFTPATKYQFTTTTKNTSTISEVFEKNFDRIFIKSLYKKSDIEFLSKYIEKISNEILNTLNTIHLLFEKMLSIILGNGFYEYNHNDVITFLQEIEFLITKINQKEQDKLKLLS